MIPMKWKEDSENSENSALDTMTQSLSHTKYMKKKYFSSVSLYFVGFTN